MFKKFTSKFQDYTLSNDKFINEVIESEEKYEIYKIYDLQPYLLNDIIKLLEKSILNRLSADLLFQKNYWSWGFVTIYYSNFYMAQLLNKIVGKFYLYKAKNFNKLISYDKNNSIYIVPQNNNGESSHLREFKQLKNNFSYLKTMEDEELELLLNIIKVDDKDTLFKFTIDNEIKEAEIRNEINYRLKYYREIEQNQKSKQINIKFYQLILNGKACLFKDNRALNLVIINQKRFLFLNILINEMKIINPAFKLKLQRLEEKLTSKYSDEFHNIHQIIKQQIKELLK